MDGLMEENDVIKVIQVMTDYADKQNNQGMKNVLLAALLTVVCSGLVGVIGYGYREIYKLSDENSNLRMKVSLLEAKQDVALEERDRILFRLIGHSEKTETTIDQSDDFPVEPVPPSEVEPSPVLAPDNDYEKFRHNIKQRVDDRMPQFEQMQQQSR